MEWALARAERSLIDVEVVTQHLEGELRTHRADRLNFSKLLGAQARDLGHIKSNHGHRPLGTKDKIRRLRVVPDVRLSGCGGVPFVGDRAAHHHHRAHTPRELWVEAEGESEVSQWANGEQVDLSRHLAGEAQDLRDRIFSNGSALRRRLVGVAEAVFAMHPLGGG